MTWHRSVAFSSLLAAAFFVASPAFSDTWPAPRGRSHEPQPYRYQPQDLKNAPKKFLEDAHACIVYYGTTHLVEADGTVETIIHEITRLNGRKGIAQLGEYRGIQFDPSYQKLILNEARVIKGDGTIVPIQPRHVKLRDAGTDYEVYDQRKELIISFPNLQVGDLYEVKWTTRGKHPENFGHFFMRYNFGTVRYPIIRDDFRVRLPKAKKLRHKVIHGKAKLSITEGDKHRLYRWILTNHPALPRDYDRPPNEELRCQLMCSTFPSWRAVGEWKKKVRKDCWECTPEIQTTVERVTKGCKTPEEKARALTYWVRRNIRYVSVVSARHRYRPRTPDAVLTNLFGDCKDQSQLLAIMFRAAGINDVYLVTLGYKGDGQIVADVPSPWGTHAVLFVNINGNDHWIDTTSSLAAWNFLPRGDRDRVAYVSDPKGGILVMRTPSSHWIDNQFDDTTLVKVQPDGTANYSRIARYGGFAAIHQRDEWTDEPPGERRRKMAAKLQDSNNRSKLQRLDLDNNNLHDLDKPVVGVVQFQIPHQFSGMPNLEASFTDSRVWGRLLAYNLDHDRKVAMDLVAPFDSYHRYIVQLPAAYRFVTTSWQRKVKSRWGFFKVQVNRNDKDDRRLEITFHTRLVNPRIDPKDFAEYREFHQAVYNNWRVWLAIEPTTRIEDHPLLEKALANNPVDIHTAKILARLYVNHNRRGSARRVLDLFKDTSNDTEIWELSSRACSTLAQEEAVYAQMVKRFPAKKDYVLDLGRVCLEQDKYEKAEKVLAALTKSETNSLKARAHYQLARIASKRKQPAHALHHLQAAKKADATVFESVNTLQFLARLHEQLQQPAEVMKAYHRILDLEPQNKDALSKMIRLLLAANREKEALPLLRRFTLAVKGELHGLVAAAQFHLQMNRPGDALDLALRARDIDFHAGAQKVLGLVYLRRGQYAKALFHLDRANQDDIEVLDGLVHGHIAMGNLTTAAKYVERNELRSTEWKRTLKIIDHLLARRKALLKSLKQPLGDKVARAVDVFVCAEYAHATDKPTDQVNDLLEKVFADRVELGPAYALRGLLYLQNGRLRSAFAAAEQALRLGPQDARAYYVRGRIRFERLDKSALSDLARAAELSERKDADILHWLAASLFEINRRKEALQTQRLAVQLRPGDVEMQRQLRRFEAKVKTEK